MFWDYRTYVEHRFLSFKQVFVLPTPPDAVVDTLTHTYRTLECVYDKKEGLSSVIKTGHIQEVWELLLLESTGIRALMFMTNALK